MQAPSFLADFAAAFLSQAAGRCIHPRDYHEPSFRIGTGGDFVLDVIRPMPNVKPD